ncbi:MAG: HIRAN domain-containing protein [Burkholderiales bacterium]
MLSRNSALSLAASLYVASWCCPLQCLAQEVRFLVQRSNLAGYRYHEAPAVAANLLPGTALDLIREADNPYDANAIRVEWQGRKLGYVPRLRNAALAWAMDRGERLSARVVADPLSNRARGRVTFEVYLH